MDKLQNIGFLLKDLTRRYIERFEEHARSLSLTLMQCKVLTTLERGEGLSQARLAEVVGVDAMTMVRLLDRMEEDHLVERRPDPDDRRARRLFLTPKAKPMLEQIWRLAALVRTEMFVGVARADRDCFLRVLEMAHGNLSKFERKAS
jgi:MarR family transcriptional regulator, transcriptional regulator for hemolysin